MKTLLSRGPSLLVFVMATAILHAQNVGIGTATPGARLHVVTTTSYPAIFENTNGTSSEVTFKNSVGTGAYVGLYSDDFEVFTLGARDIHLGTAGIYRLNITTTGNVGIATTTPTERLEIASGNIQLNSSLLGIILNSFDRPLITRGFDAFTSGNYNGIGRWGLFMEPSRLTLGFPNISGKAVEIASYEANSTRNTLMTINEQGRLRRPATGGIDLLPVAMGNIASNGAILGGSGNFTVENPSPGRFYITFNGFAYDENNFIVIATMAQVQNTNSFVFTTQVTGGRLGLLVNKPDGGATAQNVHFVMYRDN